MWSFSIPKSSIALAIIAILLFAEMNAIASLKLQSFNNNRARRNSLTADAKCCPDIGHRRTKRNFQLGIWTPFFGGVGLQASALLLGGIAGLIGAGLGLGAGLTAAGLGSSWRGKTGTSGTVQGGGGGGFPYYGVPSPMGGIYCSNGGNNGHHHYYFYPPPCYYYYG